MLIVRRTSTATAALALAAAALLEGCGGGAKADGFVGLGRVDSARVYSHMSGSDDRLTVKVIGDDGGLYCDGGTPTRGVVGVYASICNGAAGAHHFVYVQPFHRAAVPSGVECFTSDG